MFLISGLLAATSLARADLLSQKVDHDLFFSFLYNDKPDRFQQAFADLGVHQAPEMMTEDEMKQLRPAANILWNREYELIHLRLALSKLKAASPQDSEKIAKIGKQIERQQLLLQKARDIYNKRVDDISMERTASAMKFFPSTEPQVVNCQNMGVAATGNVASGPDNNPISQLAKNTAPIVQANVQTEQDKDTHTPEWKSGSTTLPTPEQLAQGGAKPSQIAAPLLTEQSSHPTQKSSLDNSNHPAIAPTKVSVPGDGGFDSDYLMSMVSDPSNSNVVYGFSGSAGTRYLLRSVDDGKSWSRVSALSSSFFDTNNDLLYDHLTVGPGGNEIFLTTTKGLFHSTDGGASFSSFTSSGGDSALSASDAKISSDGTRLTLSYGSITNSEAPGSKVVLYEKDNGVWQKSAVQPPDLTTYSNQKFAQDPKCAGNKAGECVYESDHVQISSVQADPNNPQIIYAGTGWGIYRWDPSGGWQIMSGVHNDSIVSNIDISPSTGKMLVSTCNAVYQGNVGQLGLTKVRSNSFLDQRSIYQSSPGYLRSYEVVSRDDNPNEVVTTAASGVYVSKDGGVSWNHVSGLPQSKSDEFRSAVWMPDGSIEVSGPMVGTYRFTP